MSIADRCVERFKQAKAQGQHLTLAQVHDIISEEERANLPKRRSVQMLAESSDEAWIAYLESLPHMQGIDIKREIGKCQFWCSVNGKEPTRRRITNWLNKSERTVTFNGQGQSSYAPNPRMAQPALSEPQGWNERVKGTEDENLAGRSWVSIHPFYQRRIVKLCQTP